MERSFDRSSCDIRPVELERAVMKHADGSCLIKMGDTHVLCSATIEEGLPRWRQDQRLGWLTAEYAMLPASGNKRTPREQRGRKGRSMEIERLIGRSLRACIDFKELGERTITVDCDVLQADGGTRCASITAGWVAVVDALESLVEKDVIHKMPVTNHVAAISCGIYKGEQILDLDYKEDSRADVDLNVCAMPEGRMIEVQGTGEGAVFTKDELNSLIDLAQIGLEKLFLAQKKVVEWEF